jgi:hypothetical protein
MFNLNSATMKKLITKQPALLLLGMALAACTMSFSFRGGEGFEIYLGKKLVVQQFLPQDKAIKAIDLSVAADEDLKVSFNHCGKTGTNRVLSIQDNKRVLKEWRFADNKPGASAQMSIPVKDVAALQKNLHGKQLSLFYASDLLKEGKVLAMLTSQPAQASRK